MTDADRIAALEARIAALEAMAMPAGNGLCPDRRFEIRMLARKRAAGDKLALTEYNRQRGREMGEKR